LSPEPCLIFEIGIRDLVEERERFLTDFPEVSVSLDLLGVVFDPRSIGVG
jgi:hypothetical protein